MRRIKFLILATSRVPRHSVKVKYLLSGASGMLGSALRASLLASDADVLQLVRRPPSSPDQLQWDPSADRPLAGLAALEGLSAAIHLSGAGVAARRWTSAYRSELWISRVDSTRALCRVLAALEHPPEALLVASAAGFYGDRGDELLDEGSHPGAGFLAELCREWEQAASPARDLGLRVVSLRFGVVLSRRGGALPRLLPALRFGIGGRLGSGRQWMSWIALDDAVAAVRLILDKPSLAGPFNITSPAPVTNAAFTHALAAQLHRPAMMPVPALVLRVALGQMADEALLASARVMPKRLTQAGFQFAHSTIDSALAAALR